MESKVLAIAQGADYIEQDIVISRDGQAVVCHDLWLDEISNVADVFPDRHRADGRTYVADLTWAELAQLNVNERTLLHSTARKFPGRFAARVPFSLHRLEDEIALVDGLRQTLGKSIGLHLEIKSPAWHESQGLEPVSVVHKILADSRWLDSDRPFFLQCFELATLQKWHAQVSSKTAAILLLPALEPTPDNNVDLNTLKQNFPGIRGVGAPLDHLVDGTTPSEFAKRIRASGLELHVYTLRPEYVLPGFTNMAEIVRFCQNQLGASALFADAPDQVIAALD